VTDILSITVFLLITNFLPPLASLVLSDRYKRPVDNGIAWIDQRPLLGPHKTWRGVLATLLVGPFFFPMLSVSWPVAFIGSLLVVLGDLLSSFIKRRFQIASGSPIFLLDQIFEGLFPLLFLGKMLGISWWQGSIVLLIFVPLAHFGAYFWKIIIYRPPMENYLRIVRSTVRLKEWRACHTPLARWQVYFHFPDFLFHRVWLVSVFQALGMYERGKKNALQVCIEEPQCALPDLPPAFDGFRILFLSDLHLDGIDGLDEEIVRKIKGLEYDVCLLGGDFRMEVYGPTAAALRRLRRVLREINAPYGVFGVLGNHDCIEMVPDLEESGMLVLINDSWLLEKDGQQLWIVGVDDPHYYKVHNVPMAFEKVNKDSCSVFLAHSPEIYEKAEYHGASLYLCGHTHGGQIRLPNGFAPLTNSRAPRFTAAGQWRFGKMLGYTSRGVGASGVPVRFNCPGEISLLTLRIEKNA